MALTTGVALMFSGLVAAMLIALVGSAFLVFGVAIPPNGVSRFASLGNGAVLLGVMVATAILSSGIVAPPYFYPTATFRSPGRGRMSSPGGAELKGLMPGRTGWTLGAMQAVAVVTAIAAIALLTCAVRWNAPAACALIATPVILLGGVTAIDRKWHAMNFIGPYLPPLLLGTAVLIEKLAERGARRVWRVATRLVLVVMIVSRLPRFEATARLHGGPDMPPLYRFSSAEIDAFAAAIIREGGGALVEVEEAPHFVIVLLVELGRRGIPLQWSERSWKLVLGYRPWPVPTYEKTAPLKIVLRGKPEDAGTPIVRTTQFDLVRQSQ